MLQAAQALRSPTPVLVTNDMALRRLTEVKVLLLDDMLKA
jgi:hypothetical protein